MPLQLYNFLSKKTEEFKPIKPEEVGLYTCGPTVYDFVHIGNWRTFVFEDILERVLEFNGYKVGRIMNITDIDDKIIKKSKEEGVSIEELTSKYEKAFFEDMRKLNIEVLEDLSKELSSDWVNYPRATEHIDEMIVLIKKLLDQGFAYKAEDGIYFSVEKFRDYGKLSGLEKKKLKKGARVNDDLYDKENWSDFALWKFPSANDPVSKSSNETGSLKTDPSWPAPFGEGRPGWHIECSAMSMKYLGDTFDIHTGGVDLLFPHHENEIAQSEGATGKKFVNFFLEGEHLLVDGRKMSKSLDNIYTLSDIIKKGFDPLALRYLFLTAHYRSKLNFTWKSLEAAQNALNNLTSEISTWDDPKIGCAGYEKDFRHAVNNDLDMPKAMSVMWDMTKSDYPTSARHQSILAMDQILGLGLDKVMKAILPKGAEELIKKREELRRQGKFEESDKMRSKLLDMGVEVEDTPEGPKWKIVL